MKDDGDDHDDQQEVRPAARMQTRKLLHVLDRQSLPRLVAVDGLVLRTVVLEHTANPAHKRDAPDVEEEDEQANTALDQIEHDGVIRIRRREMRRPRRNDDKEHTCKHECEENRHRDLLLRHLLVLLARRLCGEREGTHPDDEGLNHDDRAANQRQIQHGITLANRRDRVCLHFDLPVWEAHGGRGLIRITHHDTLDDRLSADRKVGYFFWHKISLLYQKRDHCTISRTIASSCCRAAKRQGAVHLTHAAISVRNASGTSRCVRPPERRADAP